MRLTADEILMRFPSMNSDKVVEKYYGDIPHSTVNSDLYNRFQDNTSVTDAFMSSYYGENEIDHYRTVYGSAYVLRNDSRVLSSQICLKYRGMVYSLDVYDMYEMSKGFTIWTSYAGKTGIKGCWSDGYRSKLELMSSHTEEMDRDEVMKILTLDNDEYGYIVKLVQQTILKMINEGNR